MDIDEFVWLPATVDKLLIKHDVQPAEVEEVFFDRPRYRFHQNGHVQGENMYTGLGQTSAGRYLTVFFLLKSDRRALIVSARDMTKPERQRYDRK